MSGMLKRLPETLNQMCVQNPVRPKVEAGNLNSVERGNAVKRLPNSAELTDCSQCKGRGWLMWVWPSERPRAVYWFQRGPRGERPHPCTACVGLDQ